MRGWSIVAAVGLVVGLAGVAAGQCDPNCAKDPDDPAEDASTMRSSPPDDPGTPGWLEALRAAVPVGAAGAALILARRVRR